MVNARRASGVADGDGAGSPRHAAPEDAAHVSGAVVHGAPEDAAPGADRRRGGAVPACPGHPSTRRFVFRRSIGWTLLAAVLPGLGLWPTRARRLGVVLATACLALGLAVALLAFTNLGSLASVAVRPSVLRLLGIGIAVLGVVSVVLITATQLATRPHPASGLQRGLGALLVGLLCFLVSAPLFVMAGYSRNQASFVDNVFKDTGLRSQTRPDLGGQRDPWSSKERVNILLLGADNTAYRDAHNAAEGIRTDTVMLASIDTATGNMALVQLPRNMEAFTFPAGSPLAKAYPQGYWDGVDNENPEYELNSVWRNVPEQNPKLFTDTDYPNADAVKIAVEGITGLKPDYFAMLSIDGLIELIDAIGGVTVNVNERLPIAQTAEQAAAGVAPKGGYLEVGPNQHLTGYKAMWYARSRSQSKDPDRMARQGCVVKAIVDQANPQTVLTRYEAIANAGKNALVTDMPQDMAPAMMELAVRMKDARVQRVLFGYPNTNYADGTQFEPWDPDEKKMHELIQAGITKSMRQPASNQPSSGQPASSAAPAPSDSATSSAPASTAPTAASSTHAASSSASASPSLARAEADLSDACAFHPVAAETPR